MNLSRFLSIALVTAGTVASAATLPYQGLLTDANGVPVADGDKAVTFGLYSQATGGTALWSEARTVATHKGLFSVALGGTNALTDDMFSKDTLFLSITISGSELVARTPIGMSAFAFRAHKADTAKFASDAAGLSRKLDTGALTTRLAGYAPTSALSAYVTTSNLASYAKTTDLNNYATAVTVTNGLGAKVDTAKLTTRLAGYATTASVATLTNFAGQKADTDMVKSNVANLQTQINGKASTATVSAVSTQLAPKADTNWVNSNFARVSIDPLDGTQIIRPGGPYPQVRAGMAALTSGNVVFYTDTVPTNYQFPNWSISVGTDGLHFGKYSGGPSATYDYFTVNPSGSVLSSGLTISRKLNVIDSVIVGKNLRVGGTIYVGTTAMNVPDYVFEPNYDLAPLSAVEAYTQANKHLPDVPAAAELEKSGIDMAQMNLILLRKVEELTLHAIQQEKRIQALEARSN